MDGLKIRINNENEFIEIQKKVFDEGGVWYDNTTEIMDYKKMQEMPTAMIVEDDFTYGSNEKRLVISYACENDFNFEDLTETEMSFNDFIEEDLKEYFNY